ncbi:MAG: glycosyltransferase family 39 protein [Chloroflexi bacterium]|nr:glycosyltransferase family 39 protein [Chloroflexota bacterium]
MIFNVRNSSQGQEWLTVIGLAVLVVLLRLPSLDQPFDNDSGAIAYHARLIVRGEPLYSTHHPAHHLPAVFYAYALAFLLFGDTVWAVKFLLILWTILSVYLLYRLGALLIDRATGILAAVFYAILSSHLWLWGPTAEIELFANLPRIAAMLVLMWLVNRRAAAWKYVFVGLLSLLAFMFKAVYLSPLALTGVVLLVELWQTRKAPGTWHEPLWRGIWLGVGFAAGLALVLLDFGLLGLLPRFFLVFTLGQRYVNLINVTTANPANWLLYPFAGLAINNAALLIYSLAGLVIIFVNIWRRHNFERHDHLTNLFYIAVWYILSFIEANASQIPFSHYYLLIVPPLVLLAAWLLLNIYRDLKNQVWPAHPARAISLLALLIIIPLVLSAQQNFSYYERYIQYKLGHGSYEDFLLAGGPAIQADVLQVQILVGYLRRHTSPSDYLYYWSESVQLYYMADRRCPIDIIWPLYAEATGPYQRIFVPQTKYVIVSLINSLPRPAWLKAELKDKYRLETVIASQEIYRRVN